MSKSSIVAFFALILGVAGLGMGFYSIFTLQNLQKSGIQKTWYLFEGPPHYTSPISTSIDIDDLLINFTVNSGESVYFLFNSRYYLFETPNSELLINFVLDGNGLYIPVYPSGWYRSNVEVRGDATLMLSTDTIPPGNHNVTIRIRGSSAANSISSSAFLIQTFIP
jgi:hypothetical protein